MESKKIRELKHKARRRSIGEGIFASAKSSFGYYYLSPFAIAINSSNSLIALLSSISGIIGPLTQTFSSKFMKNHSRKEIVIKSVFYECISWLLFFLVAFLFYKGIFVKALPLLLLFFFSIYTIFENFLIPSWFSWHGDLVDDKFRGRWFSKRSLIMGFVTIILAILAAIFLDYLKRNDMIMIGFMTLFFMAFVARIMSIKMFKRMYEPKIKLKETDYFSFYDFLLKAKENNFGRFTIFTAFLNFASFIYLPFVTIYLLRYLQFNYLVYMIIIIAGSFLSLIFLRMWGKFADTYGSYVVLYMTSAIIPIVPILWVLNSSPIYLTLVPSLMSGIAWAGFELAKNDFIYDNVRKEKRGFAVSYHNLANGIGIFLGAGLGAFLIEILKIQFVEPIILIFLIGSVSSMIVVLFGIKKIKEVRKTKRFRGGRSFKVTLLKETKPTLVEEIHEIGSIKNYLKT